MVKDGTTVLLFVPGTQLLLLLHAARYAWSSHYRCFPVSYSYAKEKCGGLEDKKRPDQLRAASYELVCRGSTLAFITAVSTPEGILVLGLRKALSSHLEVCPHRELLERPRVGQSLRDDLAREMIDNTDEKLGHLVGDSLGATSTAAVECALPSCKPKLRSVQSPGVDALALLLPLEVTVQCDARAVLRLLILSFGDECLLERLELPKKLSPRPKTAVPQCALLSHRGSPPIGSW